MRRSYFRVAVLVVVLVCAVPYSGLNANEGGSGGGGGQCPGICGLNWACPTNWQGLNVCDTQSVIFLFGHLIIFTDCTSPDNSGFCLGSGAHVGSADHYCQGFHCGGGGCNCQLGWCYCH